MQLCQFLHCSLIPSLEMQVFLIVLFSKSRNYWTCPEDEVIDLTVVTLCMMLLMFAVTFVFYLGGLILVWVLNVWSVTAKISVIVFSVEIYRFGRERTKLGIRFFYIVHVAYYSMGDDDSACFDYEWYCHKV